ncbi:MAG: hypothetical protein QM791_00360 [Ferruginibacter sp.]
MGTNKTVIYFIFFTISILYSACDTTRKNSSLKTQYKAIYVDQFKLTYLRKLLIKSYNNSTSVQEIINSDYSGFTEPILTEEDYRFIDSLTTIDNQHLIADSADGHRRAEGSQGKRSLGYIMDKLSGKWLDSLAKKRLKLNGIPGSWTD